MHNLNIVDDIDNLKWEELIPGVILYKNMLKDSKKAYEIMMNSEKNSKGKYFFQEWVPWAQYGTYTQPKQQNELENSEKNENFFLEKELYDEIAIAYDKAVSHYFKHTGIDIPEGARYSGQSWCKYFNKIDQLKNNMTMQYHTDFIISQKDMPGEKFHTTCTFYINDNYNGGDIEFYVDEKFINHKPSAGDLMIFPSGEPFYHGVKTIPDGNKFFIRNFIMFDYDGSEDWLKNQKRFGAYKWAQKELERVAYEDPRNMLYIKDGNNLPYEEVLDNKPIGDIYK
jgi:predicted 2-oxoglutarate/Fe(II)-dependent dioxygenase YbiX